MVARFYEELYQESEIQDMPDIVSSGVEDLVTVQEVVWVLAKLENNETGADDGLVAEMLESSHECLQRSIAEIHADLEWLARASRKLEHGEAESKRTTQSCLKTIRRFR